MDAARWTLVKSAFGRIQELPPDRRTAALADLDGDVRDEVASLLAALSHAPSALDGERVGPLARSGEEVAPRERIGLWRIVAPLGRGGMGVVYLGSATPGAAEANPGPTGPVRASSSPSKV